MNFINTQIKLYMEPWRILQSKETKKWSERVKDLQHEKRLTEVRERAIETQVKRKKQGKMRSKKKLYQERDRLRMEDLD